MDCLLLECGEFVIMISSVENPGIESEALANALLVAILPEGHCLADCRSVSVRDLAPEPLIGVDPTRDILCDEDATGQFFQLCSASRPGGFFLEIMQRIGSDLGYGGAERAFRIAAQRRNAWPATIP